VHSKPVNWAKKIIGASWFDEDRCNKICHLAAAESKGLLSSVRKAVSLAMIAFHEIKKLGESYPCMVGFEGIGYGFTFIWTEEQPICRTW